MTPTADCVIHVLDPDQRPVAGAECGFWPNIGWWGGGSQIYCEPMYSTVDLLTDPKRTIERFWKDRGFNAKTDAAGKAVVKNLPPKEDQFAVEHDQWELPLGPSKRRQATVQLTAGKTSEVTVILQPKGSEFLGDVPE